MQCGAKPAAQQPIKTCFQKCNPFAVNTVAMQIETLITSTNTNMTITVPTFRKFQIFNNSLQVERCLKPYVVIEIAMLQVEMIVEPIVIALIWWGLFWLHMSIVVPTINRHSILIFSMWVCTTSRVFLKSHPLPKRWDRIALKPPRWLDAEIILLPLPRPVPEFVPIPLYCWPLPKNNNNKQEI